MNIDKAYKIYLKNLEKNEIRKQLQFEKNFQFIFKRIEEQILRGVQNFGLGDFTILFYKDLEKYVMDPKTNIAFFKVKNDLPRNLHERTYLIDVGLMNMHDVENIVRSADFRVFLAEQKSLNKNYNVQNIKITRDKEVIYFLYTVGTKYDNYQRTIEV